MRVVLLSENKQERLTLLYLLLCPNKDNIYNILYYIICLTPEKYGKYHTQYISLKYNIILYKTKIIPNIIIYKTNKLPIELHKSLTKPINYQ